VKFIRKHFEQAIIIPGLGEHQTTDSIRCKSWAKGYQSGQPDLLLIKSNSFYSGLAIELKTPIGNGKLSKNQEVFLNKLKEENFRILISSDYSEIIMEITKYYHDIQN
jgi:hypothetical protein